jgi:hypothetical protein
MTLETRDLHAETFDVIVLGGGAAGLMCAIEAGKRGLRVVVLEGADRIGKKIHISGSEATFEFAFFALADLARKLWSAEHLVRENKWSSWHPDLPFLGDELTGKTIAVVGTGRIAQAVFKKCVGFDMNILCYKARGPNEKLVAAVREEMDLRHRHGLQNERMWINYVSWTKRSVSRLHQPALAAVARGRKRYAGVSLDQRVHAAQHEAHSLSGADCQVLTANGCRDQRIKYSRPVGHA